MLRERIVWIVALLLVAGVGFYSGQAMGVQAGQQNRTTAIQQFFGQRGGQAAGQGGQGGQGGFGRTGGFGGNGANGGGLNGMVSSVSGDTITVTTRAGQTTQVQLASGGTVRKQVDGQLSDIKQGDQVLAIGTQNGTTFQATSIQVGAFAGRGGQGGQGGQGGTQGGNQGGQDGSGGTGTLSGTSTTSGTDTSTTATPTRAP